MTSGVILPADVVQAITPRQSTHADVVRLLGAPTEEHEWGPGGRNRTLLYRGACTVTHPRWALGWLTSVRHRETEHHEVTVSFEDGRVREVGTVIRRVQD